MDNRVGSKPPSKLELLKQTKARRKGADTVIQSAWNHEHDLDNTRFASELVLELGKVFGGSAPMIKTIYTLGAGNKKKLLQYDWSPSGACLVLQREKPKIDCCFFLVALYHFSGQTVEGGFSQTTPALGGFGKWVEVASKRFNSRNLTSRHGSFMAAILCEQFGVESSLKGNSVMLTFPTNTRPATQK